MNNLQGLMTLMIGKNFNICTIRVECLFSDTVVNFGKDIMRCSTCKTCYLLRVKKAQGLEIFHSNKHHC